MRYRYVEDLWGNQWSIMADVLIQDYQTYVCKDPTKFANSITSDYEQIGYVNCSSEGWTKELGWDTLTKTMSMGDEETTTEYYEYDSYRFELKYRTGLLEEIKSNLDTWIEYAKKDAELPVELSDKEKIEYLLNENRSLSSDNEMLKGCIMEIADVVFA